MLLPYTKEFAVAHPRANTGLTLATSAFIVVGVIVFIQTRPQSHRDSWWAAVLFLSAAFIAGGSIWSAMHSSLTAISATRARRFMILGAIAIALGVPILVLALVSGDLRDVGQAMFLVAFGLQFVIMGRLSPRRPSWW